jgi:hypothetical protein
MDADKVEIMEAGDARGQRILDHIDDERHIIDAKIDAMPERIICILKNTGAI